MSKELDKLCGQTVSLALRFPNVSGFVIGRLSTEHCVKGDYVVENQHCQSRVIFNETQVDHVNDSQPWSVMIFLGLSDKQIEALNESAAANAANV